MATVTIENHDGRYRLRWLYQGKRYTMSCGVPATPTGKAIAKQKAAQIELDISVGYFDPTLLKYRPKTLGKTVTEISCAELFGRFAAHRQKEYGLSPGSIGRYASIKEHLSTRLDMPAHQLSDRTAGNFAAYLIERLRGGTAKTYIYLIAAAWSWGKGRYHVGDPNPWMGIAAKIKPSPQQRVKPFTAGEVKAIIGGFRSSQHYAHYADFVVLLFGVGCRFGEAAGLQWKHVADDFQTVWIGESVSRGHRKSTKTGKDRTVTLSPSVGQMLCDRHTNRNPKPDDLIFPSPQGLPINDLNFRARAWKTILEQCHIEYRKPYAVRHSAISHALANGANPMDLAEQTGHDKRVLLSTYAHAISNQSLFVEF